MRIKSWVGIVWCGILLGQQTPKEALPPELYQELKDPEATFFRQLQSIQLQHAHMMAQVAAMSQKLADLDHRLDIQRTQLNALDPSASSQRITKLEDFVIEHNRESEKRAALEIRRWDNIVNWSRGIVLCLLGFIVNAAIKWYSDRKRHLRQSAKMDALLAQTNGLTEKLVAAARAQGRMEGQRPS